MRIDNADTYSLNKYSNNMETEEIQQDWDFEQQDWDFVQPDWDFEQPDWTIVQPCK